MDMYYYDRRHNYVIFVRDVENSEQAWEKIMKSPAASLWDEFEKEENMREHIKRATSSLVVQ